MEIPAFTRPGDSTAWASLLKIKEEDFKTLVIKLPWSGEFKTLWDWYLHFYQHTKSLDHELLLINEFCGSARDYIQYFAKIKRGEIKR